MRNIFLCLTLFLLWPVFSGALTFFDMGHEPYGYVPSDAWYGQFANLNDGYGPRYATEWDDARTAAIEMRIKTPFLLTFEYGASMLTWRSKKTEPEKASRVDEMHFALGLGFQRSILGGRGWTNLGIGGQFFSNFAGYSVQLGIHRFFGLNREAVPSDKYDNSAASILFTGEVGIAMPWQWPLKASLSAVVTSLGYWEAEPELALNLESPFGHARAGVSYRITKTGNVPDTAARTIRQNSGFLMNFDFAINVFRASYWVSPVTGLSMGSYSLLFTLNPTPNPHALWHGDYRTELAFDFSTIGYVNRISWTPSGWNFGVFRTAVVFAGNSGILAAKKGERGGEQRVYIGAELYADFGKTIFVQPFIGVLGGFFSGKRTSIEDSYRADHTQTVGALVSRVELGLRFYPLGSRLSNRVLRYGLVTGLAFDLKFESPAAADLHYYLGVSFGDEAARQGLNY